MTDEQSASARGRKSTLLRYGSAVARPRALPAFEDGPRHPERASCTREIDKAEYEEKKRLIS